jgi:hypothetical protein
METPVLSAAVIAVAGDPSTERLAGDALHAWVYVVVYVGFAIQGVGTATLFGPGRTRLALALRAAVGAQQPDPGRRRVGRCAGWSRISAAGERSRSGLVRSRRVRECGARVLGGHGAAVRGRGAGVSGDDAPLRRVRNRVRLARDGCDGLLERIHPARGIRRRRRRRGHGAAAHCAGRGERRRPRRCALAMSLQAMSQEHRLIRLDVEKHPIARLD